jgi:integrase/recombinase XerD
VSAPSAIETAALRFFFCQTLKRAYPIEEVPYPKAPRCLPIILTREEAVRLIDSASNLFHRAMLITLYSTGMRRAELCHLKVEDIDSTRMLIHLPHRISVATWIVVVLTPICFRVPAYLYT